MDLCFSKRELSWLDDLMPESKKKKLDDAKKKAKEEEVRVLAPTVHSGAASNYRTWEGSHEKSACLESQVSYLGAGKIPPELFSTEKGLRTLVSVCPSFVDWITSCCFLCLASLFTRFTLRI